MGVVILLVVSWYKQRNRTESFQVVDLTKGTSLTWMENYDPNTKWIFGILEPKKIVLEMINSRKQIKKAIDK